MNRHAGPISPGCWHGCAAKLREPASRHENAVVSKEPHPFSTCTGRIVIAQTTFVDVLVAMGSSIPVAMRVCLSHPMERSRLRGSFSSLTVHTTHPLLADYLEPWLRVCIGSGPIDPAEFLNGLDVRIREQTEGWRGVRDYANPYFLADPLLRGSAFPGEVVGFVPGISRPSGGKCLVPSSAGSVPGVA